MTAVPRLPRGNPRKYVGIVGHEGAKFTAKGEAAAREMIRGLLADPESVGVSGACHLGGIDIWAREEAKALGREFIEYPPKTLRWADGFRPRNVKIAERSDIVHSIVVARFADAFTGPRYPFCYHCGTGGHIKSGGCWTAKYARNLGKLGQIRVVENEE